MLKIEQRAIEALVPYARNSRTHSDAQIAQIAASIREFGFTNPVLVDKDGGIIAGHGPPRPSRKRTSAPSHGWKRRRARTPSWARFSVGS